MLELSTPNTRTDRRLAGEFRPRTLESWLAQLPTTDRESSLQQLYKALSTQNRVALDPSLRLQLMELYLVPFRELYSRHHADLRIISRLPLNPHYRTRQEVMLSMLDAMAIGYKIVVQDLVSGRSYSRDPGLALALQRGMYCLGEVLVTAYELYLRPPGGTWREVHELYRCAEGADLLNLGVAPLPGGTGTVDVLKTYVPILLLGAGSPYGLLPGEARRLYELLPQWRRSVRITIPDGPPAEPGHFLFSLDLDAPPFPASKSTRPLDAAARAVKTLGVARAMHQILTDMNDATTQKAMQRALDPDMHPTDVELFRRAGRVFGEVGITRSSNRFPVGQEAAFHAGFDAVYVACNDDRPFDLAGSAESGTPSPDQPVEQFIDLTEPMLGVPIDGGTPGRTNDGRASGQRAPQRARIVNQSAGGICLVLSRNDDARLKVGDIAACRSRGAPDWQPGVVRWMRVSSKEIRFGLRFLGPVAVAVTAVLDAGRPREGEPGPDSVPAIWLPENAALKLANSMVLPRAAEPYPSQLAVRGGGNAPERVTLLRRVERTGDYEQFLVLLDSSEPDSLSSRSW